MICILELDDQKEISGWVIAGDIDDARRQVHAIGNLWLAQELYRVPFDVQPGKYEIPGGVGDKTYVMLIQ